LGKLHDRGGARAAVRVAVRSTRPHLDRSGACARWKENPSAIQAGGFLLVNTRRVHFRER
jgi:hypothetical protein